jgi:outer membrane receptor for ferrienterochelin and colicins
LAGYGRWFCSALLMLICGVGFGFAEDGRGRIEGQVTKDDEGVGAVVVLISELKITQVTDQDGKFTFESVPAGSYTVLFTLGDNNVARQAIVTAGKTNKLEQVVDWDVGVHEEIVVTAAARAAKIVDAPAAVTAISAEQVEQQASTGQVPKVLEFTPGAEVTQSGLYDFNFNTRGFNSSLNRRVSTYIDGRDVGVVLLGAQEWAAIAGSLDDVANLEFIRGPSAALYGANASSGVINITTKAPRESLGTLVRLTAGELDTRNIAFRRSDHLGRGWYSKFTATALTSGDFTISRNPDGSDGIPDTGDDLLFPEYSTFCRRVGETGCLLEERTLIREQDNEIYSGSFRLDKYLADDSVLTFEAGLADMSGPVFQTGIGRVQIANATRPFFRTGYASPRWSVLAHYTGREGDQVNLTKALVTDFNLISDDERYGVEGQGNWLFSQDKIRLVVGAAYTRENVDTADPNTGEQTVVYQPLTTHREAVFGQLDWQAHRKLKFVFAGRVDANTLHATQFSPKVAMVYSINPKHSLRLTYNEAFQVANYSEFFLHTKISDFPIGGFVRTICEGPALEEPVDCGIDDDFIPILAVGEDDLELEQTKAWEIGYSGLFGNRVFATIDYYNARNDNFITDLIPQVGTILGNLEDCIPEAQLPGMDPDADPRTRCPVNNAYLPWVSTEEAETTILFQNLTVAQALRNSVQRSVGGDVLTAEGQPLGFRMATDLDGDAVIVGRTYTNVGRVDTQGVDLGLQFFVTRSLSLQFSYSWFDFEIVDSDEEIADILLPNTPEHKASVSASYATKRWTATFGARWVDAFRWSTGVYQGDVPAYTTADISASYRISDLVRVGVNVANFRDDVQRQTFGGDLLARRALLFVTFTF